MRWLNLLLLVAVISLMGCSSPQKRAESRPEAFARLSPDEQRLALEGRIREGMNEDAVFIALGRPSKTLSARRDGADQIHWVYSSIVTREIPSFSHSRFRGEDGRWYGRSYYDPYYQSYVVDTFRVVFRDGRVIGWEELR